MPKPGALALKVVAESVQLAANLRKLVGEFGSLSETLGSLSETLGTLPPGSKELACRSAGTAPPCYMLGMAGEGGGRFLMGITGLIVLALAVGTSCSSRGSGGPTPDCFDEPAPICGTPCNNRCGNGCQQCSRPRDEAWCSAGVVMRCADTTCVQIVETCPEADACIVSSCAKSTDDCGAIREAYEVQLRASTVAIVRAGSGGLSPGEYGESCPYDCAIAPGDCDAGLETCWFIGGRSLEVNRLAKLYERLGCSGSVACDCPPLDVQVSCKGISSPDGSFAHNACVAQ